MQWSLSVRKHSKQTKPGTLTTLDVAICQKSFPLNILDWKGGLETLKTHRQWLRRGRRPRPWICHRCSPLPYECLHPQPKFVLTTQCLDITLTMTTLSRDWAYPRGHICSPNNSDASKEGPNLLVIDQSHLSANPKLDSDKTLYSTRLWTSRHQYSKDKYSRCYKHPFGGRSVHFLHFVLQLTSLLGANYRAMARPYRISRECLELPNPESKHFLTL